MHPELGEIFRRSPSAVGLYTMSLLAETAEGSYICLFYDSEGGTSVVSLLLSGVIIIIFWPFSARISVRAF